MKGGSPEEILLKMRHIKKKAPNRELLNNVNKAHRCFSTALRVKLNHRQLINRTLIMLQVQLLQKIQ